MRLFRAAMSVWPSTARLASTLSAGTSCERPSNDRHWLVAAGRHASWRLSVCSSPPAPAEHACGQTPGRAEQGGNKRPRGRGAGGGRAHVKGCQGGGSHGAALAAHASQVEPLLLREAVGVAGALLQARGAPPVLRSVLQLGAHVLVLGPPAAAAAGGSQHWLCPQGLLPGTASRSHMCEREGSGVMAQRQAAGQGGGSTCSCD